MRIPPNQKFYFGTFLLVFVLVVSGCNDSAITGVADNSKDQIDQLDTPESYIEAIALAQRNLFTHAQSAIREMDEEEFEKVMGNVEKVLERSPGYRAEGDFVAKKFSEEEYVMQNTEWYKSNRDDILDAFDPIIPRESLMEIRRLTTEFFTIMESMDPAEIDTTAWQEIMRKTYQSKDAKFQEIGNVGCSSPQKIIPVNHASFVPIPSMERIMGWFGRKQAVCRSCCIECCNCSSGCDSDLMDNTGGALVSGLGTFGSCLAFTWVIGPISWGGCSFAGLAAFEIHFAVAIFNGFRCMHRCKNRDDCQMCPDSHYQYSYGIDCQNAHNW